MGAKRSVDRKNRMFAKEGRQGKKKEKYSINILGRTNRLGEEGRCRNMNKRKFANKSGNSKNQQSQRRK